MISCRRQQCNAGFRKIVLSYENTNKILQTPRKALQKYEMKNTRKTPATTEHDLLQLYLMLSKQIHTLFLEPVKAIAAQRAENNKQYKIEKLSKKFEKFPEGIKEDMTGKPSVDIQKVIYNVSSCDLPESEKMVMSKGFNDALTPKRVPNEEIICDVQTAICELEDTEKKSPGRSRKNH